MEEQYCSESSDITFISEYNVNEDHIDRALKNLKDTQTQNEVIRREIQFIRNNPKKFAKPARDSIVGKINSLKDENDSLKRMIEKVKAPTYTEMTKKKIVHQDASPLRDSLSNSYRPNRNPLEELDSNYDKQDGRSTCLNYGNKNSQQNNNYTTDPSDQEAREAISQEIRILLRRADVFEEELTQISRREGQVRMTGSQEQGTRQELQGIAEYKKKLLNLLKKIKGREAAMQDVTFTYRTMHEETIKRLQQATQTLQSLRVAKISQDVDQKYAQILELEQRLHYIDAQLQEMDETRWLQQISAELVQAVKRMGLQIPHIKDRRELIDELCSILIEGHIVNRKDSQNKVNMLKHYHEEEKKNNSKYIMGLKTKEQALGRKLIDIQMQK